MNLNLSRSRAYLYFAMQTWLRRYYRCTVRNALACYCRCFRRNSPSKLQFTYTEATRPLHYFSLIPCYYYFWYSRVGLFKRWRSVIFQNYSLTFLFFFSQQNFQLAAACLFTAWFNLLLTLREFPVIGIFFIMFTRILKNSIIVLIVFTPLVLAFSFTFSIITPTLVSVVSAQSSRFWLGCVKPRESATVHRALGLETFFTQALRSALPDYAFCSGVMSEKKTSPPF